MYRLSMIVSGGVVMGLSSLAGASDVTDASVNLATLGNSAVSWGNWMIFLGFVGGVAMYALGSQLGGLRSLIALPAGSFVVGALLRGAALFTQPAAAATLPPEPAPIISVIERLPVHTVILP